MPLMTTKPMFDLAYDGGFAVGAFNVNNMELAQAIIDACAAEKSPLILQISKGARKYANIRYLKAIIDAAVAEHPELPIAIHCDHGDTVDLIQTCINDGYTCVMIDGSHHPYEENVKLTAEAVKVAHAAGVVVEAELGMLGGIEEDVVGLDAEEYEKNVEKFLTDPVQATDFWQAHRASTAWPSPSAPATGRFKFKHEAKLAFNRIEQIMKTCPGLPLVMHGSSSVPQEFIDLVNKYGGKMPNAKGVPEDQIAHGRQQVRRVQGEHRHRPAPGDDRQDPRSLRHQAGGVRPAQLPRPGPRGDHQDGAAQAAHAQQRRQSRCGQQAVGKSSASRCRSF